MNYLFTRATGAIGISPPAYHADLVCTRVRICFKKELDPRSDARSVASSQVGGTDRNVHKNTMNSIPYIKIPCKSRRNVKREVAGGVMHLILYCTTATEV